MYTHTHTYTYSKKVCVVGTSRPFSSFCIFQVCLEKLKDLLSASHTPSGEDAAILRMGRILAFLGLASSWFSWERQGKIISMFCPSVLMT